MKIRKEKLSLIFACILLFCSACSANTDNVNSGVVSTTDEFGNHVIESSGRRTVMLDSLPYDLPYNETHISLVDVSFYENVVDYSHNLFIVTTLDVSNLDDAQLHWLRESDLDVRAYLTFAKNDYDFRTAPDLGSLLLTDKKQLLFVHTSSFLEENRYSFSGAELSLTVQTTQEETYEYTSDSGEISQLHSKEELHYSTTVGTEIPDPDEIKYPLNKYVLDWLREKTGSY